MSDFPNPCRVLLVEDSPVVALDAEQTLQDHGFHVVGPAPNMASALDLAQKELLDAAVVDINIRGGKSFPILKILADRGIPFLLTSGYGDWSMPREWQARPRLSKPYNVDRLVQEVSVLCDLKENPARR